MYNNIVNFVLEKNYEKVISICDMLIEMGFGKDMKS